MTDDLTAGLTCRSCRRPFAPTHDVTAPGPKVRHPFVADMAPGGLLIVDDPAGHDRCGCPAALLARGLHFAGCGAVPGCSCPKTAHLTGARAVDCPAHGIPAEQRSRGLAVDRVIVDDLIRWQTLGTTTAAPSRWRSLEVDAIADADDLERKLARDQLRQRTARAYDVPLWTVDDDRGRAEFALRAAELDRWADDGGPAPRDLELPPLTITLTADPAAFLAALGRAVRQLFDPFRQLAAAFVAAGRQLGRAFGMGPASLAARRWPHDTVPRRWRDWLPAAEPKVDRARREHLERQLRTRGRRQARRRRIATRREQRARLAGELYRVRDAGRSGAAALTVLRDAAAAARHAELTRWRVTEEITAAVLPPAGHLGVISSVTS